MIDRVLGVVTEAKEKPPSAGRSSRSGGNPLLVDEVGNEDAHALWVCGGGSRGVPPRSSICQYLLGMPMSTTSGQRAEVVVGSVESRPADMTTEQKSRKIRKEPRRLLIVRA